MDVAQPPSVDYLMYSQMVQAVVRKGGREAGRKKERERMRFLCIWQLVFLTLVIFLPEHMLRAFQLACLLPLKVLQRSPQILWPTHAYLTWFT